MKKIKKSTIIIILIAILLAGIILAVNFMNSSIEVEAEAVSMGSVEKVIKESGTVESETSVEIVGKNSEEVDVVKVKEGQKVNKGEVLAKTKKTSSELSIKSMESQLSGLRSQYKQAKEVADKNYKLYEQGALSYETYRTSSTTAKALLSEINALNYSIESFNESSAKAEIIAPISGVVTAIYVKAGETISLGSPVVEISDVDNLYVKVNLIAEDADIIEAGFAAYVYNEDSGFYDKECKVKKIHLKAQDVVSELGVSQKRVVTEIAFGQFERPRLGSNVDVEIVAEKKESVMRVKENAIFEKDGKESVFVINDDKAELRVIEKGLSGEDYTEVISGLNEGETVILSPAEELKSGSRVKIKGE